MKNKTLLIMIVFIIPTLLLGQNSKEDYINSERTIIVYPDYVKIKNKSMNKWEFKNLQSPNISIAYSNGLKKFSTDYGETWIYETQEQSGDFSYGFSLFTNSTSILIDKNWRSNDFQIYLVDLEGNQHHTVNYSLEPKHQVMLNINGIQNGFYLVFVKTKSEQRFIGKLLISK